MVQIIPSTVVGKWNVIQGMVYIFVSSFFMIYPQIMDIFDDSLTNMDYKIVQMGSVGVFVIGSIFIHNGLPHYLNYLLSKLVGIEYCSNIQGSEVMFAVAVSHGRIVTVPIICLIAIFTYGVGNTSITVLCVAFALLDPFLSIITLFIVKKYGTEALTHENALKSNSDEYKAPQIMSQ